MAAFLTDADVGLAPASTPEAGLRTKIDGGMGADPEAFRREITTSQRDLTRVSGASRELLQGHIADMQRQLDALGQMALKPEAPTPTGGPSDTGLWTDAEVFGGRKSAPTMERKPRSDSSIALGGIAAGARAVARTFADFGDMFLSIPGMAVGTAADIASRVQSLADGTDPRAAGRIAQGVREGVTSTFSPSVLRDLTELAINAVAPDKGRLNRTDVQNGMELITEGAKKGGKWVEERTNGLITAETFDSLLNEGMALGGVRGAGSLAKRLTPAEKARTSNGLPEPVRPPPESPAAAQARADVEAMWARTHPTPPEGRAATARNATDASAGLAQWKPYTDPLKERGVQRLTPEEMKAETDARRAQAQQAFTEDPEYADYLRNYADEEARVREQRAPVFTPPESPEGMAASGADLSAPGGRPTTGPRTPRTGSREAAADEGLPPANPPSLETGNPPVLDSALEKLRTGRSFTLTAEEKIQMNSLRSSFRRPDIQVEEGYRSVRPGQRGASTLDATKLVAKLGVAAGLAAYAYYHREDAETALLAGIGSVEGARHALGPLLNDYGYTTKVLGRLGTSRTEFTAQQIKEQLARPDVSKAEKELVAKVPGGREKISAKELVEGFKREAQALTLKPVETDEWADYGLSNIDREPQVREDEAGTTFPGSPNAPLARTTVYQSPLDLGDKNHFEDPNYFAHTRSFDEGGVRHVVEIQSDVAQHAKVLTKEQIAQAEGSARLTRRLADLADDARATITLRDPPHRIVAALDRLEQGFDPDVRLDHRLQLGLKIAEAVSGRGDTSLGRHINRLMAQGKADGVYAFVRQAFVDEGRADHWVDTKHLEEPLRTALHKETLRLEARAHEANNALRGVVPEAIQPLLKTWYKRIIREELAQGGRAAEESRSLGRQLADSGLDSERGKALASRDGAVRFATADTVAKVEGWPELRAAQVGRVAKLSPEKLEEFKQTFWDRQDTKNEVARILREKNAEIVKEAGNDPAEIAKIPARQASAAANMEKAKKYDKLFFFPDHAGIYVRHKELITPYLEKDLKGKPYTDPKGHTWIEVPPQPRGPTYMLGRASPADLAALAGFVGGAVAMQAWSSDPSLIKDVIAGLALSAATRLRPKSIVELARSARAARPLESIDKGAILREANLRLVGLDIANVIKKLSKVTPDLASREKVHLALDAGKLDSLTPKEKEAALLLRGEYARLAEIGKDAGVLENTRRDYATHMWKMGGDLFDRLFGKRLGGSGGSPNTPYALQRVFATIPEGERAGLVAVSKDAAYVYAVYTHSLLAAVENTRLLATIKAQKSVDGSLLIQKAADAPRQYEAINNPQLRGLAVHPEIASQMRFIFENPSSTGIPALLETIADVGKRSAVSGSLFHVKALIDVLVAATPMKGRYIAGAAVGAAVGYGASTLFGSDHPGRDAALAGLAGFVGERMKGYAMGKSSFLQEVGKGSASPLIVRAVRSGLVFGSEKGGLIVDDAGRKFYDAMTKVQEYADKLFSPVGIKAGKPIELYIKANHAMDEVMWGRLHPGMKLEVWSKTSDILMENSVKRSNGGKNRILTKEEADHLASKYTNDLFGGLNWTRIAMEASTRIGRMVAQSVLSPKGRQVMRIMMFAPDWTISTARSALAAIDKDLVNPLKWGDVAQGMFRPITRGDLARQYVARSALYYLVVGDAINYSMSGHHLWQNDDKVGWSFIDWGDGRRLQFSKHIMESVHWVDHPMKQAIGKLGYVPKEILNQGFGTEYISPQSGRSGQVFAGPKMQDTSPIGRLEHAGRGLVPIPLQSKDLESFAWGEAGMPIYGKTKEQMERIREQRAERRRDGI